MKIGVIGYGYWGPRLARNLHAAGFDIEFIAEHKEVNRLIAKKDFPSAQVFSSHDSLTAFTSDAVVIATQAESHYTLAKSFLEAGSHVLLEKPFVLSVKEAHDLISIADRKKLVLMVDHTYLYSDAINEIKSIISSGALGNIFHLRSIRTNLGHFKKGVNVLWDLAPHDISLIHFLFDSRVRFIRCEAVEELNNFIACNIELVLENGVKCTVFCSWASPVKERVLTIAGEKMLLHFDESLKKIEIIERPLERESRADLGQVSRKTIETCNSEPLRLMADDFISSIMNNSLPVSNAYFSADIINVLEHAEKSILSGNKAEIKWL